MHEAGGHLSDEQLTGRLELTWTNKHLALLADALGGYEWLPPTDYRIAETRLLRTTGSYGRTSRESKRASDNLVIRGDALNALRSLTQLHEFAGEFVGNVKLAYLDPPFNTQQAFPNYDDALEHSVWLTMIRDRLLQVRALLSNDGSVWVHCDDSEQAYLRVVLDEVMGRDNFVACVIWEKKAGTDSRPGISSVHDYILVFARDKGIWSDRRNPMPFGERQLARYENPDNDPRGVWQSGDMSAQGGHGTKSQFYSITLPSGRIVDPAPGRCWIYTPERYEEVKADNRLWFGKEGNNAPAR